MTKEQIQTVVKTKLSTQLKQITSKIKEYKKTLIVLSVSFIIMFSLGFCLGKFLKTKGEVKQVSELKVELNDALSNSRAMQLRNEEMEKTIAEMTVCNSDLESQVAEMKTVISDINSLTMQTESVLSKFSNSSATISETLKSMKENQVLIVEYIEMVKEKTENCE